MRLRFIDCASFSLLPLYFFGGGGEVACLLSCLSSAVVREQGTVGL